MLVGLIEGRFRGVMGFSTRQARQATSRVKRLASIPPPS